MPSDEAMGIWLEATKASTYALLGRATNPAILPATVIDKALAKRDAEIAAIIRERVETASGWLHNSRDWWSEERPGSDQTIIDWIFDAQAILSGEYRK